MLTGETHAFHGTLVLKFKCFLYFNDFLVMKVYWGEGGGVWFFYKKIIKLLPPGFWCRGAELHAAESPKTKVPDRWVFDITIAYF